MVIGLLMLYLLLITPVRLTLSVSHAGETRILVQAKVWGIPLRWRIRSRRLRKGRVTTLLRKNHPPSEAPPDTGRRILTMAGAYLRSNRARAFLRAHLHLIRLEAMLRLSLADAAQTALAAGLLGALSRLVSLRMHAKAWVQVIPAFFDRQTTLHSRCILFFRLGTILITAALAGTAYLLERREHPPSAAKEA